MEERNDGFLIGVCQGAEDCGRNDEKDEEMIEGNERMIEEWSDY